jgi:hypothetical protein
MKIPSEKTLKKYGLNDLEYAKMFNDQDGACFICGKAPKDGRTLNVDHVHVRGFKKMFPDQRKKFVRGLLCYFCNRFYMAKAMTEEKAIRIIQYLKVYNDKQGKKKWI